MSGLVSQIGGSYQPIRADLPLITQVPLLVIHMVEVQRKINILSGRGERRVTRRWNGRRKWIASGITKIRIGQAARGRGQRNVVTPRSRCTKIAGGKCLWRIEEDTVRCADALGPFARGIPRDADTGREAAPVAVRIRFGNPWVAIELK